MDFKKTHISVIGDFTLVTQTGGATPVIKHEYLHRDHIGSIVAISKNTVASANDVQWQSNGAWGERRYQQWNGPLDNLLNPDSTAKGFTDHEHLDAVGLIHMNGRVYDPELGRFMSADPFVQAPYNSQSYNRYSYVFNNPLSFTDPTGYITKDYCPGNTTATCTSDNKDKEEPALEEVIVTGDREQHLRRMEAVDQSNLAGWQSWASHREIMVNATAGLYIGLASINGGTYVWNDHEISLTDGSEGSVMTLDDAAALGGGIDQLVGLTGMYLTKTIKKGQLSSIRENNWKGFSYQSGLRKSLQYLNFGSKFLFGVGTIISAKQGVNAAGAGDNLGVFKSLLDVGVGYAATKSHVGFAGGVTYYGTSTLLQYSSTARNLLVEKPVDMTLWIHDKVGICTGCY